MMATFCKQRGLAYMNMQRFSQKGYHARQAWYRRRKAKKDSEIPNQAGSDLKA